jgi:Methyl-accepting chemotaxis protein
MKGCHNLVRLKIMCKGCNESRKNSYESISEDFSERTHRLTGYLIVDNSMDQQNQVLKSIRHWMIGLSVIAIVIFLGLSYLIVNSVVQPIKKMSQISHDINKDPTDKRRVPDLHRNDELGELATSFNKMLDRMQAYMQQQKQFVGDVLMN